MNAPWHDLEKCKKRTSGREESYIADRIIYYTTYAFIDCQLFMTK